MFYKVNSVLFTSMKISKCEDLHFLTFSGETPAPPVKTSIIVEIDLLHTFFVLFAGGDPLHHPLCEYFFSTHKNLFFGWEDLGEGV